MPQLMDVPSPSPPVLRPEPRRSVDRLSADVATAAALVGARVDEGRVLQVLRTFEAAFTTAAMELRITTREAPVPPLWFRYVDIDNGVNPLPAALQAGIVPPAPKPVLDLVPDLLGLDLPMLGWGVDAGAATGFEKIWPFFTEAHPIERAFAVASMPPSVKASEGYLRAHGLTHFSIVAVDYLHATMNLYFIVRAPLTAAEVARMLVDAGLEVPGAQELEYAARGVAIAVTYNWQSPSVERLCFYVPAPDASLLPEFTPQLLRHFGRTAPVAADHRGYIMGCTYLQRGSYLKMEVDYSGTTLGVLLRCAGVSVRQ